ncbi:unnamed protein product [Sphagnum jensenii]|uniref:Thioredoxin domain-containing protein n=1 Tax=Sphagnum jensenii TaxID=128206 RepID=A0ABP1AVT9_9BRYO
MAYGGFYRNMILKSSGCWFDSLPRHVFLLRDGQSGCANLILTSISRMGSEGRLLAAQIHSGPHHHDHHVSDETIMPASYFRGVHSSGDMKENDSFSSSAAPGGLLLQSSAGAGLKLFAPPSSSSRIGSVVRRDGEWSSSGGDLEQDASSRAGDLTCGAAATRCQGRRVEAWQSEDRNELMRSLQSMRADIRSLKMMLRFLEEPVLCVPSAALQPKSMSSASMHPVLRLKPNETPSTSTPYEKQSISDLPGDEATELHPIDLPISSRQMVSPAAPSGLSVQNEKGNDGSVQIRARKQKQWWKELLTAVGFTMWVMAGAVLIAKVIGVPNLGVGTVAYNMSHSAGISEEDSDHHPNAMQHGVIELTDCDFEDNIRRRPTFVMFYAPWCPHCRRLHPTWADLENVVTKQGFNVQIAILDATKHIRFADLYDVPGFPTLILFEHGVPVARHKGARDIESLLAFLESNLSGK